MKIEEFQGEFRWLSNFWPCQILLGGEELGTVEHAFQASKAITVEDFNFVTHSPTPGEAKRRGRQIKIRKDWDEVKLDIMRALILQKFTNPLNKDLREKLLATGDAELIEGNRWGDTFWGVCNKVGENHLGKIIMEVRDWLK